MRFAATVLLAASMCGAVLADDGEIYRCLVSDFRHGGPGFGADPAFKAANMRKTFDIFDLGDRYQVIVNTKDFQPATDSYQISSRGLLGTVAIDHSSSSDLNGLVLYARPEGQPNQRVNVTITRQSATSVNIWYLNCVQVN